MLRPRQLPILLHDSHTELIPLGTPIWIVLEITGGVLVLNFIDAHVSYLRPLQRYIQKRRRGLLENRFVRQSGPTSADHSSKPCRSVTPSQEGLNLFPDASRIAVSVKVFVEVDCLRNMPDD